ncbi:prostamide/prostaglandin F synthase-like [Macrosteles quadrilineatus]|uniref:prostamide/prostaglandin F synthase-like n=1 Tax=Macrosteles quadrilineatus TaxID=74068 RepID=UPI0023E1466D|nr:prostamide/prostaglandin F synthase-like [Macrosteles quadrilineatus]
MAVDLTDIEKMEIKDVGTNQMETLENVWKDKTCVIIFFRRWGCLYCRLWAKEVSQIANILSNNNIRLIGVGPEQLGVEEFKEGKFFDGELFVDVDKKVYSKIGFKRYNYLSILWYIMGRVGRSAYNRGKAANIPWNLQGDGLQNGGCLIVEKGGRILHSYRQDGAADQLSNDKILEVLDLTAEIRPRLETDLDADSKSESSDRN